MTYGELIEEVQENIALHPRANEVQRGEIKRLLNLSMREISLELGVPTIYVTVPSTGMAVGAVTLPVKVHPEGVVYAEVVEIGESDSYGADAMKNRELALMSASEANVFHPRWESDEPANYTGPPFLIWSPGDPDRGVQPVGITSARYRFLVHAVPEPMTDDEDEPFALLGHDVDEATDVGERQPGAMPAFHRILAHHVSYELLQRLESDRWQAFYARYEKMKQDMFSQITPPQVYLPTMRKGRRVTYRA